MKRFLLLAAFLVAFTGTALAQNGSTVVKTSYCGWMYNSCCDEWIEMCFDVHLNYDKTGWLKSINSKGSGTGASGTKYNYAYNDLYKFNYHDNGGGNYTISYRARLTATGGSDCGSYVNVLIHVTWNSNGEPTAVVEKIVSECDNAEIG